MSFGPGATSCGRLISAMAALLLATSCVGRFERPHIPDVIVTPPPNGKTGGNYTLEEYNKDLSSYASAEGAAAVKLRNKIVYGLMAEIDYAFYDYETKLFLNQGTFRIGSDFLQLGLAAGSTVTKGERGKTILSALLSGVAGVSLSVDKNLFRQQTVQAIASSMEANRDRIKTIILQQLKQDTSTYPFEAARSDLIRYFFAGTLPSGLQQLHQDAAANAQAQKVNLNQVQVSNISAEDVKSVSEANQAIGKAFQDNDLTKVTSFLKAMGAISEDSPGKDKLESALRELGKKITTDEALRKKYFDEVKKAGLIQ
jgi:hypothetical protein